MPKRKKPDMRFVEKTSDKGKKYYQGLDDHDNFFLFQDQVESKKQEQNIFNLIIKQPKS